MRCPPTVLRGRRRPRPGRLSVSLLCLTVLSTACAGDPEARKQRYFESGTAYLQRNALKEAVIELRNAVELDPTFAQGHARLAEAYARLGDGSNALGAYVRAADLMPDALDVQLSAGRYLLAAGRFDDALARADAVIARDGTNVMAHVLRGNALSGLNDLDQSLAALEEAIRLDPSRGSSYTQLGVLELARGRRDEARAALRKAVELDPKWIGGYLALANEQWSSGEIQDAERSLQRALELDPKNDTANRAMAALAITSNRSADAERFLKAIAGQRDRPGGTLALADYYLRTGRAGEAVAQLEPLVAGPTATPGAKLRLVQALAASGQAARATQLLDEVLRADVGDADAWLVKAQMQLAAGERDAALETARRALDANPASASVHFLLGQLHAARGDTSAARQSYTEVLRLNPRAAAAQVELSRLQLAAGLIDDSLRSARDAAANEPGLGTQLALVRSLLAARDMAAAARELTTLRATNGTDPQVQVLSGLLAAQSGDSAGARTQFERVLAAQPDQFEALAALVSLDMAGGQTAQARQRIEDRIQGGRTPAPLLLLLARVRAATGDPAGSEQSLREAIAADPNFQPAYSALGQLLVSQRRLDAARQEFDALAARQSNPVASLTLAGMILNAQGDRDGAMERYRRALAADPTAAVANNNLAWLYAEEGRDLETALRLAQAAAKARPDAPEIVDTLGWIYYKKNQADQALPLLRQNAVRVPGNAVYQYRLGLAELQAGNAGTGRRTLEKALALGAEGAIAEDIRRTLRAEVRE